MPLLQRMRNTFAHVRRHGVRRSVQYATERIPEAYNEWRLGISTAGKVQLEDSGIDSPFSVPYYPSDYRSIHRAFRRLEVRAGQDVFLDYGCGMGRVLAVAATLPFRRVIGIELSTELSGIARENLRRAKGKFRCPDVEVITGDATTYEVPTDVSVVFLYNPFHGPVLASVLDALGTSLESRPREMTVVFKNTTHLESMLPRYEWLLRTQEFAASDGGHNVAIFEARPAAAPIGAP